GYRFGRIIVRGPGAARCGQENRGKKTDGGPRRDAAYLRLTDAFPNARKDSTHPSLLRLPEAVSAPALSSTSCSRTPNGSPYTIKIGVGRKAFHVVSRQGGRSSLAHGQTSLLAGGVHPGIGVEFDRVAPRPIATTLDPCRIRHITDGLFHATSYFQCPARSWD